MKVLLDAQLDSPPDLPVTQALNVFGMEVDLEFEALAALRPTLQDEEIPAFCVERGAIALVTANVRDFGARLPLYEALLEAGDSVVVLRPNRRIVLVPRVQASILIHHVARVAGHLSDSAVPVLLKVTEGGVQVVRTLEELAHAVGDRTLP